MQNVGNNRDHFDRPYISGMNCCKCGRFIGKDGNCDIGYDEYMGGYEIGYPTCRKCLDERKR